MNFAIIDIETTGGSPKDSKITEIAIFKHNGKAVIDSYETLINPEIPIPPFIANLTGIRDDMVADSPRFYEVAKEIVEFTRDCVFVAHNVAFDYSVLRTEFRSLGYDYRLPNLCTVKTARKIIPGHESYSLGKLTRSLGITLTGRHRAGGDALATAELFSLLYATDSEMLHSMVNEEVNPKKLHPKLNIEILDEIPNQTGVYTFYNEVNEIIYIGKSNHLKKRIEQHLRSKKTKKESTLRAEVSRIEFTLTGSELIAQLIETKFIKQHEPAYNNIPKRSKFPYGVFQYYDDNGYIRFSVLLNSKMTGRPISSFSSKKEAVAFLSQKVASYSLCQKLSDLYTSNGSCFQYTVNTCNGACIKEESPESYNKRCQQFINDSAIDNGTFYIIGKGRERKEKSLIYIKDGCFRGYGYAPFHFNKQPEKRWEQFIDLQSEDRDTHVLVKQYLNKSKDLNIVTVS